MKILIIIKIIKKRVAPIMPENFKNSKFNRGKGHTDPLKEENQDNINENKNINNLNINENNIKSLWEEFQNNYEQKDEDELEDFHDNEEDDDEIKMNPNVGNKIFDKNNFKDNNNFNNFNNLNNNKINFNNFNNDEEKEEIPVEEKEPIQEKLEYEEKFKKNDILKEKEDFGIINEDYIKKIMNYDVPDVE